MKKLNSIIRVSLTLSAITTFSFSGSAQEQDAQPSPKRGADVQPATVRSQTVPPRPGVQKGTNTPPDLKTNLTPPNSSPKDTAKIGGRREQGSSSSSNVGGMTTKSKGDTSALPQFENAMEFEPRKPGEKVTFSLEEANLAELVRVIGQLTGRRFIFGGKVRDIKATIYSPEKITVAEAYQAFLSILETNGLTVVPHGRFLKIVETPGVQGQNTPVYTPGQAVPPEERYITRLHRLQSIAAEEVVALLAKFKSKDAELAAYAPGNMLIMTDTGANIRRMMQIVDQIDIGGAAGDQIWFESMYYASASDVVNRINELFDIKAGADKKGATGTGSGDLHISKVIADDRTNSLIIVATERAYLRMLEFIKKLDVPQTGEGEIHTVALQHADAVELVKTLNDIVGGAGGGSPSSKPGTNPSSGVFEGSVKLSADKSTNSIVVTSSLRDYASLRAVLNKLDQPRRQVFIDAVIMDLNVTRTDKLGVKWHGGGVLGDSGKESLIFGGLDPLSTILAPDATSLQGGALGIRGPGIDGSQNLIPGIGISIPAFGATITALTTTSDTDVLSTPHILATDNVPAEISIGENVPLQTNSGLTSLGSLAGATGVGGTAASLGALSSLGSLGSSNLRQDVGTKIKVTPHLNESDEARLEIQEEISEARAPEGNLGVVPITKRTANTTVVVKDQQTVVIGGLVRSRIAHGESKIPFLGDIPLIGALFRQTTSSVQKTNLVLVLTPYIIRDQSDLRRVFERKMQERQEFLDRYFVFTNEQNYEPPKDYSRMNGLLEEMRQNYLKVEEAKKLEELIRPKELKTHTPGTPLDVPVPNKSPKSPISGSESSDGKLQDGVRSVANPNVTSGSRSRDQNVLPSRRGERVEGRDE